MKNTKNQKVLIDAIDKKLPQTHCQKCGFKSCMPYAKAIVKNNESIDKCEPGGSKVLESLAIIMGQELPEEKNITVDNPPKLVFIDPQSCIGCALCLPKCPVDAIVGARGFLHTVLTEECTGCMLCVNPCPVDCIIEIERSDHIPWDFKKASKSRDNYNAKQKRLSKSKANVTQNNISRLKDRLFLTKTNG